METTSGIKVIGALMIGALVGAALGVLYAPQRGYRTRRKILDGAKDLVEDFKEKMKNEVDELCKKAEDLDSKVKEKMENAEEANVPES